MSKKAQPEPVVYSSLGLQALCQKLQNVETCSILNLGPVRSGNVDFWARFRPFIFVADLRSGLPLPPSPPDESEFVAPDWDTLLGLPENHSYDVILAWDLLNYMDMPAVSSLVVYLKRFCRPGTIFLVLIFDQKEMPDKITVYHIEDESHLRYEHASSDVRACPRHQPRALAGVMSQFRVSESFRLRNSIVEFLFEFETSSR